ncbi:hypothetical protein EDB89DRAFT_1913562 [Lactarius sanguifluus]|nr:hypothetical protein EDB89DRAFT_1913562 [Lactarius sanguifluus]
MTTATTAGGLMQADQAARATMTMRWWRGVQGRWEVIGSTAPRAGPFGVQGHHTVTLRRRDGAVALRRRHGALTATRRHSASMLRHRRGTLVLRQPHGAMLPHRRRAAAAWCWYATTPTPYGHAMTATWRHAATPTPRHSSLALVRYDANAVWSRYDSDSAPRYDTDATPQQLGAATRYDAVWSCYDSNSVPSHYDTDAAPQQLGAGTLTRMPRGHAATATRRQQQVPTTPTPRCSNTALQLR